MKRSALTTLAAIVAITATTTETRACWRCRARCGGASVVWRARVRVYASTCVAPVVIPAPAPAPATTPQAVAPATAAAPVGDGPAAFLASLNLWRSWYGRGPVGWDAGLAALAASNAGVHDGTANQCWSSSPSLMTSLRMWQGSPAHAAILLGATVAVGASPCPSGATCNAR